MIAGAVVTAVICLVPFAGLVAGVAGDRACLWPSLVSVAALAALYWRYRRFADPNSVATVLWLPTFPAAAVVFVYAMLRSTVLTLTRGGVVWRDTLYPLGELREHAGPLR
jgi:hypothetical protein